MSYNKDKQFNDGEVLAAADLNELVEGINGSVTNISLGPDNVTLTITKNNGDIETITLPSGGGVSEEILAGYVKKTDYARGDVGGVVKVQASGAKGVNLEDNGTLYVVVAGENVVKGKSDDKYPLTSKWVDLIVKLGLTPNQLQWNDDEKTAACKTIGAVRLATSKKVVYATDSDGQSTTVSYSNGTFGSAIVQRNPDGSIQVPTPEEGKTLGAIHAVNWTVLQNYVESKIGDISTMLNSILDLQEATE